jgi:hypothetical protein
MIKAKAGSTEAMLIIPTQRKNPLTKQDIWQFLAIYNSPR